MVNFKTNLRNVVKKVALLAVTTMVVACGGNGDDNNNGTNPPIVGMWRADYSTIKSVIFFNKDGTFIMFSYRSSGSDIDAEHFRGNYKLNDNKIEATNVYRFTHDFMIGRDKPKEYEAAFNVRDIIAEGTRAEILKLENPKHPSYLRNINPETFIDWYSFGNRTGALVFDDANTINTDLFGAYNKYTRVKE